MLTGPKPPPVETWSGYLFRSNIFSCCCGVWLVERRQGSDSTCPHRLSVLPAKRPAAPRCTPLHPAAPRQHAGNGGWTHAPGPDAVPAALAHACAGDTCTGGSFSPPRAHVVSRVPCVLPLRRGAARAPAPARAHLGQEGGLHPQVAGHHVEAEEVSVDAGPGHGQAVHVLVLFSRQLEEPLALCSLQRELGSGSGSCHPQSGHPGCSAVLARSGCAALGEMVSRDGNLPRERDVPKA